LHLAVLSMLLIGRSAWSSFLSLVTSKGFLALEVVLIATVLFHGLNGIREALVGSGIAVSHERAMLWGATALATAGAVFAALHFPVKTQTRIRVEIRIHQHACEHVRETAAVPLERSCVHLVTGKTM
jgi:hypothetical protein